MFTASHWVALAICAALAVGGLWLGAGRERSILDFGDGTAVKNAPIGAKPAIVILPFENQSEDKTRDYFADGVTQDIIFALGRFSALTVMSWNAVLPYKGIDPQARERSGAALRCAISSKERPSDR